MNKTIRIALLICSALIAALTGICICADRLRATEIRANFLRENAEQLRLAERIVAEQLQIFLTQLDALSPEKFNLHAKQRAAEASLWGESAVAFALCDIVPQEQQPPSFYADFFGVAGLANDGGRLTGNATDSQISSAVCSEFINEIVRFVDGRFPCQKHSWRHRIPSASRPDSPSHLPRYGHWKCYASGTAPYPEKYFSSGFRFYEDAGTIFAAREVRAPSILRLLQGVRISEKRLEDKLSAALSAFIPGAKIRVGLSRRTTEILGLPVEIRLPLAEAASKPARLQKEFRWVLVLAWFAGVVLVVAVFLIVVHLQKISEARKLFSSAIVHDLNTPLARIEARAELLLRNCRTQAAEAPQTAEGLCRDIRRFRMLSDNFFLASKMAHTGTYGLRFSVYGFGELIERVSALLAETLGESCADLELDISPEAEQAKVLVSEIALERILMNLAGNAIKSACPPASLFVRLSASLTADGKTLNIYFADNGPGIPEKIRETLFCAFASGTQGLGIGLSLSRELARAQGGELRLEKTGSTGTTFLLSLKTAS